MDACICILIGGSGGMGQVRDEADSGACTSESTGGGTKRERELGRSVCGARHGGGRHRPLTCGKNEPRHIRHALHYNIKSAKQQATAFDRSRW